METKLVSRKKIHLESKINNSIPENNRIGFLGGTFDPIHNGHLMIAKAAMEEYGLSKVFLIPTGISYMKTGVTDSYFRYEMTKLAAKQEKGFEVSDVEIKREGNTYTCDTIAYFKEQYPFAKLYFIIGTDSLFTMEKWRNIDYIFENATILCATRNGEYSENDVEEAELLKANELFHKFHAKIEFIHCEIMDISSTEIRKYRKEHSDTIPDSLEIPMEVADYIYRHDLYDAKTEKIHNLLKADLKPKRFIHTLGVVDTATKLALKWGCDLEKARLAALLHDCAKYVDNNEKMALCAKYNVSVSDIETENTELLHAKAGALLAYEKYSIQDTEILSAIYYHTTGKPDMCLLEQIIFVADYIEPGRHHSDKLPKYRKLVMDDLNKATAYILRDTVEYLKRKQLTSNIIIDPMTHKTYEYYKKYL